MKILAADIGGTNTRLVYMEISGNQKTVLAEKTFTSANYTGFDPLLDCFLDEFNIEDTIDTACFAVAGPVKSGEASVTNLPWVLNERQLKMSLKIPHVKLINDFIAVAYGVSTLSDEDILVLQQGQGKGVLHNRDAAVVGAGTGLGAAHLVWQKDRYLAYSSETGHVGFSPQTPLQHELLCWLEKQQDYVCLEMILSGSGLVRIYQFLSETEKYSESMDIKKAMRTSDPAQVITDAALAQSDELCQKTLECFIEIYGGAAGDIVLHYYPLAELYIAGGIASKISSKMTDKCFVEAFANKGVMTSNMKEITIKLVRDEKVGLRGAILVAQIPLTR